jgi:site-specific recombinase XerD
MPPAGRRSCGGPLSGVRRIRQIPPIRRSPLLLADIRTLITSIGESAADCPAGVAARRDMALLLMGFAGAHRRSELVALTLGDVTLHQADGLHGDRCLLVLSQQAGVPYQHLATLWTCRSRDGHR